MIFHFKNSENFSPKVRAQLELKINQQITNPDIKGLITMYETAHNRMRKDFKEGIRMMDESKKKKKIAQLKSKKAFIKNQGKITKNYFVQQILAMTSEETIIFQKKIIDQFFQKDHASNQG